MPQHIRWLGHDTFRIAGEKIIYTDPFKLQEKDIADIILITHDHFDHCSPDDIRMIQGEDTFIVAPPDCAQKLSGKVKTIRPGETMNIEGIAIEAVPAYNTNKQFHPRDKEWVGYLFIMDGKKFYLAGDTDYIPEMASFAGIDMAFLPVSGTYVMTVDEAVQAARTIKPKIAVPMHHGTIVGLDSDGERFANALKGIIDVIIFQRG